MRRLVPFLLATGFAISPVFAEGMFNTGLENPLIVLRGSLGHLNGQARELVYDPANGDKISELIWDINNAATVNLGASFLLSDRWTVSADATMGVHVDGYMNDYDWIGTPTPTDFTDHSWHEDTELDHYVALDLGVAYKVHQGTTSDVSFLAGLKYTNVQWTAYGGCYSYNSGVDVGCFADGVAGITYNQVLPAVYAGIGLDRTFDNLKVSVAGLGGLTVFAEDYDAHWMRGLEFVEEFAPSPFVALKAKADYAFKPYMNLFATAEYNHYFEMVGPTTITAMGGGGSAYIDGDAAGASLRTLNIAIGASYLF
jgi:omptin